MTSNGDRLSRPQTSRPAWIAIVAALALIPAEASAHVKWFCSTADVTQAPLAVEFHQELTRL